MFDPQSQATGTNYTGTIGFLAVGLLFTPVVLALSHPFGNAALYLSLVFSLLCLAFARITWTTTSQLSIPTIGIDENIRLRWEGRSPADAQLARMATPKPRSLMGRGDWS